MRSAGEIDTPVEDVSAGTDGHRRLGEHRDTERVRIDPGDPLLEQHIGLLVAGHEHARPLLVVGPTKPGVCILFADHLPVRGIEDEEAPPVRYAIDETIRPEAQVCVLLHAGEHDPMPVDPFGRHVHKVELRLSGLLLAAGARVGGGAAQQLAVREGHEAHRGVFRKEGRVLDQCPGPGFPIPEQQAAAGVPVARGAGQDDGLPVGMCQEAVRAVDGGRALGEEEGIGVRSSLFGGRPRTRWIPFQQEPARVPADEEAVPLTGYGVPLAVACAVGPRVGLRVVAEETHGEGRTAADRAIGGGR